MSRITTVKYASAYDVSQESAKTERLNKVAAMIAAGQTDGVSYYNNQDPPDAIYQRSWNTEADAQEWIDHVNSLGNVDYARIEPDGATWTAGFVLWDKG
jgi:hypothetical protein